MHKKFLVVWLIVFVMIFVVGFHIDLGGTSSGTDIVDAHTFVDDVGNLVEFDKPFNRIVSLSSMHTVNLYKIGAGDKIVGVNTASTFPINVSELPRFSLSKEADIDRIIKLNPDLVIVDPTINANHASFVTRIETAGLKVISLGPDNIDDFDMYIKKLGMVTGKNKEATESIEEFHNSLEEIEKTASTINDKKTVFFERNEAGYLTAGRESLPYIAMENINAINIAEPELSKKPDGDSATYGIKNIMKNKDNIDVYLTMVGTSDSGAGIVSTKQKKEFEGINAIKNNRIYEMENELINTYSFRYILGTTEMGRAVYPEVFDDVTSFENEKTLTRANFSEIVVKMLHAPIYINTKSNYYEYERFNHLYGSYKDVPWTDKQFDYIETASSRMYIRPLAKDGKVETFGKDKVITKDDVANFLYMLYNIEDTDTQKTIKDIGESKKAKMVQSVVDEGYMELENGEFNPKDTYTNKEFIQFMNECLSKHKIDLVKEIK